MKWAVPELRRINRPVLFDESLDLSNELVGFNNIKSVSEAHITGKGYEYEDGRFLFHINIKLDLVLTCAVSLLDVPYQLDLETDEIYAFNNDEDEDIYLIDGQTIDLLPAVMTLILVNIPMRVVKEGYEYESEPVEEEINPAFLALKDYFK